MVPPNNFSKLSGGKYRELTSSSTIGSEVATAVPASLRSAGIKDEDRGAPLGPQLTPRTLQYLGPHNQLM